MTKPPKLQDKFARFEIADSDKSSQDRRETLASLDPQERYDYFCQQISEQLDVTPEQIREFIELDIGSVDIKAQADYLQGMLGGMQKVAEKIIMDALVDANATFSHRL